ncbi:MAG: phage holin family protein [Burkholderiales bacterium]|jgi:putative membrane protein|nr:phage holin family protein [Burkholderiales bacterium]
MRLLLVWILSAVALYLVTLIVPGVTVDTYLTAFVAAIVLSFANTLIKPILIVLTLPVTIVTLGLFLIVINALLFWGVGSFLPGFRVEGFWSAVGGVLLYSFFSWALSFLLPDSYARRT